NLHAVMLTPSVGRRDTLSVGWCGLAHSAVVAEQVGRQLALTIRMLRSSGRVAERGLRQTTPSGGRREDRFSKPLPSRFRSRVRHRSFRSTCLGRRASSNDVAILERPVIVTAHWRTYHNRRYCPSRKTVSH